MRDILLIGGMGSGKTTLAEALIVEMPEIHYIYMSLYATRIPLTLNATTHPNILGLSKEDYIKAIIENRGLKCHKFERPDLDGWGQTAMERYGVTLHAEIALAALDLSKLNVVDNIPKSSNIIFLKNHGLYVVGTHCTFDTQVQRRLENLKDIDPPDRKALEQQVRDTTAYFEVTGALELADVVYDTEAITKQDYPAIARDVIRAASNPA